MDGRRKGEALIHWILFPISQLFPMENYVQGFICIKYEYQYIHREAWKQKRDACKRWRYCVNLVRLHDELAALVFVKSVNFLNNILSVDDQITTFYFRHFEQDSHYIQWIILALGNMIKINNLKVCDRMRALDQINLLCIWRTSSFLF